MTEAISVGHNSSTMTLEERLPLEYQDLGERVSDALLKARDLPVEITSDDENSLIAEIDKALRALAGEAEENRTKEVKPHLTAQREVNAFFKGYTDRISKARDILEKRSRKYLLDKAEKERQARIEAARIAQEEAEKKLREAQAAEEANRPAFADFALDQAERAEGRAHLAAEAAEAPIAELARTETADGGTAGLRGNWTFTVEDRSKVPLDQLRAFFSDAEMDKAIRGFVRAGGRQLAGVKIFQEQKASFR